MRLLLAEDEHSLSKALTAILISNYFSVDTAYDGEEALEYLASTQYDGVILDIMMPRLDGLSVLRTIRAQGNPVPVLMLTAKSDVKDKVLGLDSGADDYLSKPFSSQELLARIRAMTRNKSAPRDAFLRMGNMTLNRTNFELVTPHGSARLPNKEFQMLEMLMRQPDWLISLERFAEAIWGLDSDVEESAVRVHISCLRKILAQLSADYRIASARNAGYRLEKLS